MATIHAITELIARLEEVKSGALLEKNLWLANGTVSGLNTAIPVASFNELSRLKGIQGLLYQTQTSLDSAITFVRERDTARVLQRRSESAIDGHCGFDDLPNEVLIRIFTFFFDLDEFGPHTETRCLLAKVSKRFCSLVYGTPTFWTSVGTFLTYGGLSAQIAFTKSYPLRVILKNDSSIHRMQLKKCLTYLKERSDRWSQLAVLRLDIKTWTTIKEVFGQTTFPKVERLSLSELYGKRSVVSWNQSSIFEEWQFPALKSLSLVKGMPPVDIVAFLTHLRIDELRSQTGSGIVTLVSALQKAKLLQTLDIAIVPASVITRLAIVPTQVITYHDHDWLYQEPGIASLPVLTKLVIYMAHREKDYGRRMAKTDMSNHLPMMREALCWLTRALDAPSLESVKIVYKYDINYSLNYNLHSRSQFFPDRTKFENVRDVSLSFFNTLPGKERSETRHAEACNTMLHAVLTRFPNIANLELDLDMHDRLISYLQKFPSVRRLTLHRLKTPISATDLLEFLKHLRSGAFGAKRFNLHTDELLPMKTKLTFQNCRTTIAMNELVGSTWLCWETGQPRLLA